MWRGSVPGPGAPSAVAGGVAAYFLYLTAPSLRAQFSPDDLMNCHMVWVRPTAALLADHLCFWRPTPIYRPLGALAYKLSYWCCGFELRPLRSLLLLGLGAAVWLTYLLARRLGGSREAGAVAALLVAYHGNTTPLVYNTGTVARYLDGTAHFLNQVFDSPGAFTRAAALVFLAGLLAVAVRARSRAMVWCAFWFVCGTLPLVFLTSPRGLDAAVIPRTGLSVYAALLAVRFRDLLLIGLHRLLPQTTALGRALA
ncbi:MAG: hypothetical protein NZM33_11950, partial [Bryobacteraceae bacterium]|nr:hypothetical protein [Bryobacteraceae bacterium]